MSIKKDTIRYVADLARIGLSEQEEGLFAEQLNHILTYVDQLNKLDTKDIEPMSHVVSMSNVLRDDIPKSGLSNSDALNNAPEREEGSFKVPKIIE